MTPLKPCSFIQFTYTVVHKSQFILSAVHYSNSALHGLVAREVIQVYRPQLDTTLALFLQPIHLHTLQQVTIHFVCRALF